MGMAFSMHGEKRNAYRVLVGKQEGKRPLERPGHRLEDNIKMDLRELGWDGMGWYGLVWYGLVLTGLFWLKIGKSEGFLCTW
jgi:hypothetical protein